MPRPTVDITGQRFTRLIVRSMEIRRAANGSTRAWCISDCDCGTVGYAAPAQGIKSGKVTSCGCRRLEIMRENQSRATHGMSRTPEFSVWQGMLRRCEYAHDTSYADYGGRGICVSAEFHDFVTFIEHVGRRPSAAYSIDRFPDNNGNYERGNVRWATAKQQSLNRRNNRLIELHRETKPLAVWAEQFDKPAGTVGRRIDRGWDIEHALEHSTSYDDRVTSYRTPPVTFRGQTKQLEEWGSDLGIRAQTLRRRIRAGWPLEQALTRPLRVMRRGWKWRKKAQPDFSVLGSVSI